MGKALSKKGGGISSSVNAVFLALVSQKKNGRCLLLHDELRGTTTTTKVKNEMGETC